MVDVLVLRYSSCAFNRSHILILQRQRWFLVILIHRSTRLELVRVNETELIEVDDARLIIVQMMVYLFKVVQAEPYSDPFQPLYKLLKAELAVIIRINGSKGKSEIFEFLFNSNVNVSNKLFYLIQLRGLSLSLEFYACFHHV